MRGIIFENQFRHPSHVMFRKEIELKCSNIKFGSVSDVPNFDTAVRERAFDIYVLDIMTEEDNVICHKTGKLVDRNRVGIELARRIRSGFYSIQNKDAFIIFRTARAKEPGFTEMATDADCVFDPCRDDSLIYECINKYYRSYSKDC